MESVIESFLPFGIKSAYLVTVTCLTVLSLVWGLVKIKRVEKKRVSLAENMDVSAPVDTENSDEDIESITRGKAITSIEARFNFIRKAYVPFVLLVAAFLIFLPVLPNISKTYITLLAGVITVVIGIAGKPVIENAISGVVLTLSQPIRINDTVIIDGMYGTVERINLLYTVVKVWNWRRFIIPNHVLLHKEFENLSQVDESEWAYVEFFVAPDAPIEKVKKIAKESMQCKYLDLTEPPSFWVMDLQKDAVKCWVAGWANSPADAWALRSTVRKNLAIKLQNEGIKFQSIKSHVKLEKTAEKIDQTMS